MLGIKQISGLQDHIGDAVLRDGSQPFTGPIRGPRTVLTGTTPTANMLSGNHFYIELAGNTTLSISNAANGDVITLLVEQPDSGDPEHTLTISPPGGRALRKPDDLSSLAAKTGNSALTLYSMIAEDGYLIVSKAALGAVS